MFINPRQIIEDGILTHPLYKNVDEWPAKYIQPNALDFTLDSLREINTDFLAVLDEDKKTMRPSTIVPTHNGYWKLEKGGLFDGTSTMYVTLPRGVSAILVPRSTLVRNGVWTVNGLYDSGFSGNIGFTMFTPGGDIKIKPGTRVGQIIFVESGTAEMYAGGYNHDNGLHWTEGVKKPNLLTQVEVPVYNKPNDKSNIIKPGLN